VLQLFEHAPPMLEDCLIPGRVTPTTWTKLAACPASCSVLMGECKGTVHTRCYHWLATSADSLRKLSRGPQCKQVQWVPQTTH